MVETREQRQSTTEFSWIYVEMNKVFLPTSADEQPWEYFGRLVSKWEFAKRTNDTTPTTLVRAIANCS